MAGNDSLNLVELLDTPTKGSRQLLPDSILRPFLPYASNLSAAIAVWGLVSNILIIITYHKIGILKSTTNICFSCLAVCDVISISWMFLTRMNDKKVVQQARLPISLRDACLIMAPIFYMSSATGSFVTAIISMERSCCVVFPLKVKLIFTRKNVIILLLAMLIYQVATATPFWCTFGLTEVTDPKTNWTKVIFDPSKQNAQVALLSISLSFSLPTSICFILVVVGTALLITTYNRSRLLRQAMTSKDQDSRTAKDARLVKTVILICVIYIFGFWLNVGRFVASAIYPALYLFDPVLGNLVALITALAVLFQTTSSSVNIFVYLKMNTIFRNTFKSLFVSNKKTKDGEFSK